MKPHDGFTAIRCQPDLAAMAAALESRRHKIEIDVLAMVLAHSRRETCKRGVELARAAGITAAVFDRDDLALIFDVVVIATDAGHGLAQVLRFCRMALERDGKWDATAPMHWRGPAWSDESLVGLATEWPSAEWLPVYARRLIDLRRRRRIAIEHFEQTKAALSGIDEPASGSPVVIVTSTGSRPRR